MRDERYARRQARLLTVRKTLAAALLFFLLGSMAGAQATSDSSAPIQRLEVAFWPEYDRPEVLVMYRGELDPSIPLPTQIALPIPVEVGQPHAVAWRNDEGGLIKALHTLDVADGRAILSLTIPSRSFRVEYYQAIEREGDRRSFSFEWPGGPEIGQLAYEIQTPLGATELVVQPIAGSPRVGGDGMTYLTAELGRVDPGATRVIDFSYSKASDALSASVLAPDSPPATVPSTAVSPPTQPPPGGASTTQWWPVYVAIALLVGFMAGVALERSKD